MSVLQDSRSLIPKEKMEDDAGKSTTKDKKSLPDFNLKHDTLVRYRDDLVGKRILCIPRTFDVATPSPAQISSSLWSPTTLANLNGAEVIPYWCQKHHHHQSNRQNLLESIESKQYETNLQNDSKVDVESAKRGRILRPGLTRNKVNSTNHNVSYSVLRGSYRVDSALTSTSLGTRDKLSDGKLNCDDTNYSSFTCQLCDCRESITGAHIDPKQHLASLPWRSGVIRAVSHRDLRDEALSIMVEFDLLGWEARDWYQIYSRHSDQYENSDGKLRPVINENIDFEASLKHDSEEYSKKKLKQANQEIDSNEDCRLDVPLEKASTVTTLSQQECLTGEHKLDRSSEKFIPKSEVLVEPEDKLNQGAFSVLLIESSICCVNRQNSPSGKDKLWPALVSILRRSLISHHHRFV